MLFLLLFVCGGIALLLFRPQDFLPVLLAAGEKAGVLCLGLVSSYCLWLGWMQVLTDCNLSDKLSKALLPLTKKLFRAEKETQAPLAMNLSANLLGLSSLATPYGIRAVKACEGKKSGEFTQAMLFVVSATSLQLLPTTALSLLSLHACRSPYAILPPTLLTTAFSTLTGVLLTKLCFFFKEKRRKMK